MKRALRPLFLVVPAAPLDPLAAPLLQEDDVVALVKPVHGMGMVVDQFAGGFVHVPKFHFCVPLSFLSTGIIAHSTGLVKN